MNRFLKTTSVALAFILLCAAPCLAGTTISVRSALLYPASSPNIQSPAPPTQSAATPSAPTAGNAGTAKPGVTTTPTASINTTAATPSAPVTNAPATTPGSAQQNQMSSGTPAAGLVKGAASEVDTANKDSAYIRARYTAQTAKRVKIKIEYTNAKGSTTAYSYDLNGKGDWEIFPLQQGNGKYVVKVMENIEGTRYSVKQTVDLDVKYANPNAPFLIPMQLINYTETSKVVKKAAELCASQGTDLLKAQACIKWIEDTIKYDTDKAKQIVNGQLTGYIPSIDVIFDAKKGICFDYSSVLAAMLRSQGIPTKLVMGYVPVNGSNVYHAWNEIFIAGQGWVKTNAQISFDGKSWSRADSTFSSGGSNNNEYIGNGSNYAKDKEY